LRVYCLINNITDVPKCHCGTLTSLTSWSWNGGFRKECPTCAMKNPARTKKIQNTCLEKYGTLTNLQTPEVTEKRLAAQKTPEYSEKLKQVWADKTDDELESRKIKTIKTNLKKYGAENQFSKESSLFELIQENSKSAILEKYGVDNVSQYPEIIEKIKQTQIARGYARSPDQKADAEKYYSKVWEFTNKAYRDNYYELTMNETIIRGKEYHLDHIYSIHYGFINSIPPYIIGHKNNLRLLEASENSRKNKRCDITIDEILRN